MKRGKFIVMVIVMSIFTVTAWSQDKAFGPDFKNTETWKKKGIVPLWTADKILPKGPVFKNAPTHQLRSKEITVEARMRVRPKNTFGPRSKNRKPWG